MKIGLAGTDLTQKTDIVYKVKKLPCSRDYNIFVFPENDEITMETQIQSLSEKVFHLNNDYFISHDSVFDTIANISTAKQITIDNRMLLTDLAKQLIIKYDVIAYVEPEISKNPRMDAITKHLIERNPPKKLLILKGTLDQKIAIIVDFLNIYKSNQ